MWRRGTMAFMMEFNTICKPDDTNTHFSKVWSIETQSTNKQTNKLQTHLAPPIRVEAVAAPWTLGAPWRPGLQVSPRRDGLLLACDPSWPRPSHWTTCTDNKRCNFTFFINDTTSGGIVTKWSDTLPDDDDNEIQQVPPAAYVGARVHDQTVGKDLSEGLDGEDDEEDVLHLFLEREEEVTFVCWCKTGVTFF